MLSSQLKIARDIKDLLWMVLEMRKNMPKHRALALRPKYRVRNKQKQRLYEYGY